MRAPRSFLLVFVVACGGGSSEATTASAPRPSSQASLATSPIVRSGYACPPGPALAIEPVSQAGVFGSAEFQISLDGRIIAARTTSHEIQIWNATNGAKVAALTSSGTVAMSAIRPDGRALATVEGNKLLLRDLERGAFGTIALAGGNIESLGWSLDSRTLFVTHAQSTELVDATGAVRGSLPVVALAGGIASDGRSLFARDGTMWDVATARPRWRAPKVPHAIAISENGATVAVGSDDGKVIGVLDALTGAKRWELTMHRRSGDIALSPDGISVAAYDSGETRPGGHGALERGIALWHAGKRVRVWLASESEDVLPAFSPDSKSLAFVSRHISEARLYDHEINVADVATGVTRSLPYSKSMPLALTGKLRGITPRWSADGTRIFEAGDGGLYVFDATTGARRIVAEGASEEMITGERDVVWGPDDMTMVVLDEAGDRQTFRSIAGVWDLRTGALHAALDARGTGDTRHAHHFLSGEYAPDGSLVALARDDSVVLWDGSSKEPARILDGDLGDNVGRLLALSPNSRVLATGSRAEIRLWDAKSGARIRTIALSDAMVETIAFSADGTRLAIASGLHGRQSRSAEVLVYDAGTGTLVHTLHAEQKASSQDLEAVHWGPKGRAIVTVDSSGRVALWNAAADDPPQTLIEKASLGPSALGADGNLLFMGRDTVDVWDLRTGTRVRQLPGDGSAIEHLRLSHDGNAIAVVRGDHVDVYRVSDLAHAVLRTPSVFKQNEGFTALADGGLFAGGPAVVGALRVHEGTNLLEVRPLRAEEVRVLYRPSLVADLVAGCPIQAAR